jgi:hypothetical protein
LILTEVGWDAPIRKTERSPIFLLTWEVDDGLVRGNLVTDTRAVTISLWPDTTYRIQVSSGRKNAHTNFRMCVTSRLSPGRRIVFIDIDHYFLHNDPSRTYEYSLKRSTYPGLAPIFCVVCTKRQKL